MQRHGVVFVGDCIRRLTVILPDGAREWIYAEPERWAELTKPAPEPDEPDDPE